MYLFGYVDLNCSCEITVASYKDLRCSALDSLSGAWAPECIDSVVAAYELSCSEVWQLLVSGQRSNSCPHHCKRSRFLTTLDHQEVPKSTLLKHARSVIFSISTKLCNLLHYLIPEHFLPHENLTPTNTDHQF